MSNTDYSWRPHPGMQTEFCSRGEMEILGGGAAGPGKTDCLIAMALRNTWHPRYRGLILRRTHPRMQEILDRTRELYPEAVPGAEWKDKEKRWHFPTGAKIQLGSMQHETDKFDYHGKEYHFVGFDELTEFLESQYLFLFSRTRRTKDLPFRLIFRATTNPGGIGHGWVKRRFRIGTVEPGETIREEFILPTGEIRTTTRAFIPGRIEDNPSVDAAEYMTNLMHLSKVEQDRLMLGIWDAFEGQAFRELNKDVHEITWDPPAEWARFGSFDWGSAKPWSYGLWAVDFDGVLYRYAEHFGGKIDEKSGEFMDEGTRQNEPEIARAILKLEERHGTPRTRIADPAIWSRKPSKGNGPPGPSVESCLRAEGLNFVKGDNDRLHGRRQLHLRLSVDVESGKPSMFVHKRCRAWWQTIPLLCEAEKNPEDIEDKDAPDHCLHGDTIVWTREGPRKIRRLLGTRGYVLTVSGVWTSYYDCRMTRQRAEVVTVRFADGQEITCTGDHRFLLENGEWKEASSLLGSVCYNGVTELVRGEETICGQPSLAERFRSLMGSGSTCAGNIFKMMASAFTGLCGNIGTVLSGTVGTFITGTEIGAITTPTISFSWEEPSTDCSTLKTQTTQLGSEQCAKVLASGTAAQTGKSGIESNMRNTARENYTRENSAAARLAEETTRPLRPASFVALLAGHPPGELVGLTPSPESAPPVVNCSKPTNTASKRPAQGNAEGKSVVVSVEPAGRADVYCLVAHGTHAFAVANGVVVKNCYDETRYGIMSRPMRPRAPTKKDSGSFQDARRKLIAAKKQAARRGISVAQAYGGGR